MVASWLIFLCMAVYASCWPLSKPLRLNESLMLNKETQDMLKYVFKLQHNGNLNVSEKVNVSTPQNLMEECQWWNLVHFNESLNTVMIRDKTDGDDIGSKLRIRLQELTETWLQKNSMESDLKCQTLPKTPMQFLEQLETFLKELLENMHQKVEQ